jgi:hypothetical protein
MNIPTSTQSMKYTPTHNENGIDARCGRRGCKIVELPFDGSISSICGITKRRFISVYRLSDRGTPTWEVVRWDIDEPTSLLSKTAW